MTRTVSYQTAATIVARVAGSFGGLRFVTDTPPSGGGTAYLDLSSNAAPVHTLIGVRLTGRRETTGSGYDSDVTRLHCRVKPFAVVELCPTRMTTRVRHSTSRRNGSDSGRLPIGWVAASVGYVSTTGVGGRGEGVWRGYMGAAGHNRWVRSSPTDHSVSTKISLLLDDDDGYLVVQFVFQQYPFRCGCVLLRGQRADDTDILRRVDGRPFTDGE